MPKKNIRNFIGYGAKGKKIIWPNNARLALQIVLNYEEGGENCVLNGDKYSETFLSEIIGAKAIKGRHISMESIYEYGSKAGFWRLDKLFKEKKIPITIFGVGLALKQNPEVCEAIKNGNYEIAAHGYRWIDYQNVKKTVEKKHMQQAIKTIKDIDLRTFNDFIIITVIANAFLHNMVRIMVGTLVDIAKKENNMSIRDIIEKKDRSIAGKTAPASGLFFLGPRYPDEFKINTCEKDIFDRYKTNEALN